ncbi:MAG: DUF4097 domain-containing protein [bacterium]|nr:DUF4097 domain-containing protein [bacterium]
MKRSTKIWLTVAGSLAAAGLLLFTIGMCMGGNNQVRDWIENGELSWGFGGFFWGNGSSVKFNDRYPVYEGTESRARIEGAGQVDTLRFEISGGQVELRESGDDGYYFSSEDAEKYQCYAENGVLELRVKGRFMAVNQRVEDHVITLWLPKDADYRKIDLELGGGVLEIGTLSGQEILIDAGGGRITADKLAGSQVALELGAGEITLQGVEADRFAIDLGAGEVTAAALSARELDVDIGAGQVSIAGGAVQNADFSVGMGKIGYSGAITGDLDAECSMGEIDLELTGNKEDHNYEVECSMGDIEIDGSSVSGMAASRKMDFGAVSDFDLECSMGSIRVNFTD